MRARPTLTAGIVAVVALAVTSWHVNAAWNDRRDSVEALRRATTALGDAQASLADARLRVHAADLDARRAAASHGGAQLSVDNRTLQVQATTRDRDAAQAARDGQNSQVSIVRQCLDGAGKALDASQRGDSAAAVAALQSVDNACRQANNASGGTPPAYAFDFPDPFVLAANGSLYAYGTNATAGNIQVLRQNGDGAWVTAGDALGPLPAWAGKGRTWAPAVLPRNGGYVLYYTVLQALTGRQCISRATASSVTGPFLDTSIAPMECGDSGAIDPEPVTAVDGSLTLLWKHENPAAILATPMSPDGLTLAGPSHHLLGVSRSWEHGVVEAPSMVVDGTGTWLFFSGNDWNGRHYATGVARCYGPLGPCDTGSASPLLTSHDELAGPGGASAFVDTHGQRRLAFHAYQDPKVGYPESRLLHIAKLDLSSGRPVLVE